MTNLLTVHDADEYADEQATETRLKLQEWADRHLPADEAVGIKPMADETIKSVRAFGAIEFQRSVDLLAEKPKFNPAGLFGKLLAGFAHSTLAMVKQYNRETHTRELSHALEGSVREFQKQFFQAGMKWDEHAEWLALAALHCPHRSSAYQDMVVFQQLGLGNVASISLSNYEIGALQNDEYAPPYATVRSAIQDKFSGLLDWLVGLSGVQAQNFETSTLIRNVVGMDYAGIQLHYMEEDGPWVAGFLSVDDACRLKFRRIRLGAYLAEQGLLAAEVRTQVERAKQRVAGAVFEAYPNDCLWDGVYTNGPQSCMADSADNYETWDGHHPTTVYSSAFHGAGDNSLVLLISRDGDGTITGRGILNLQAGSIVSWYGDHIAERVLKRNGVDTDNRGVLKGSWLALVQEGTKFIHPYVDGDYGHGRIDGNRVYIISYDDHADSVDLQDTSGSSYLGASFYCIDVETEVPEDECNFQEISRTYISGVCSDWRCPVIDEWYNDRSYMTIHGVEVVVSDFVFYNDTQFLTQDDILGWTIDNREQRRRFLFEYSEAYEDAEAMLEATAEDEDAA